MFPKINRVSQKEMKSLFKGGVRRGSPLFSFRYLFSQTPTAPKVAFIAPKTVARTAVKRNKLRRQGYAALKKQFSQLPVGLIAVFVFQKADTTIVEIENDIQSLLKPVIQNEKSAH